MKYFNKYGKRILTLVLVAVVVSVGMVGILTPTKVSATGDEGLTPGFWKNHTEAWPAGINPGDPVNSLFANADLYGLGNATLLQGLSFKGGSGLEGAAQILLRAAIAAALNAASPDVNYYLPTLDQVILRVNNWLWYGYHWESRDPMINGAAELDLHNNMGVPDD